MNRRFFLAGGASAFALAAAPAPLRAGGPTLHVVKMMNKTPDGRRMGFAPDFLEIQPGHTVRFEPTDKGHNVESIEGMLPDGAEAWRGGLNKAVEITLSHAGVYGYRCKPHFGLGMVGLIVVGDAAGNLEAAKAVRHRGRKPKKAFKTLFEKIDR